MGMKLFSDGKTTSPNPDPKRFRIESVSVAKRKRSIVVVEAVYPGCTTFEGRKILVYEAELKQFAPDYPKELDPHFSEAGLSPIARFPATDEGLADALAFADWKSRQ
jgi:hypothetical protein